MHLMLTKWNVIFIRIYTSYTFFSLSYTHIHTHTHTHLYRFLQLGIGLFKSNGWCGRNISILIGIVQCMMFLIFQWKSALVSFSFFEIKNSYIMSAHKMMESSFSWWSTHQSEPQESTRVQCYTVNYAHILLNGTTNKCRKKIPLIFFSIQICRTLNWTPEWLTMCVAHIGVYVCVMPVHSAMMNSNYYFYQLLSEHPHNLCISLFFHAMFVSICWQSHFLLMFLKMTKIRVNCYSKPTKSIAWFTS